MQTIEEIKNDDVFMKKLANVQSADEVKALWKSKGYEVTDEDAQYAFDTRESFEFNEDDLENVSGGIAFAIAASAVGSFMLGAGVVAFIGGYAYYKFFRK